MKIKLEEIALKSGYSIATVSRVLSGKAKGRSQSVYDIVHTARDLGYIETLYGRRLYLRDINAGNGIRRQAAERAAINAPVQGTAADIMKIAMINTHLELKNKKLNARMTLQVHDELIIESPPEEADEVVTLIKKSMSEAAKLKVPLEVDVGIGNNWDQAH